jgi:hypothetical protein
MLTRIALALPLMLALAACSTPTQRVERLASYEENPRYSFARNVMAASGRPGIRDGMGPEGGSVTARQGGGSVATMGAGALTGNVGLGLGLGLLRGLEGRGYDPGTRNMVIAWMPADMAVDGVDARNQLNALAASALSEALSANNIPFSVERFDVDLSKTFADVPVIFRLETPACENICRAYTVGTSLPLALAQTPSFVGTGQSYATLALRDYGTVEWWRLSDGIPQSALSTDELILYKEMSRNLPDWAFVYLAPNQWVSCVDDGCKARQYPVLLHRGVVHDFAAPSRQIAGVQ